MFRPLHHRNRVSLRYATLVGGVAKGSLGVSLNMEALPKTVNTKYGVMTSSKMAYVMYELHPSGLNVCMFTVPWIVDVGVRRVYGIHSDGSRYLVG